MNGEWWSCLVTSFRAFDACPIWDINFPSVWYFALIFFLYLCIHLIGRETERRGDREINFSSIASLPKWPVLGREPVTSSWPPMWATDPCTWAIECLSRYIKQEARLEFEAPGLWPGSCRGSSITRDGLTHCVTLLPSLFYFKSRMKKLYLRGKGNDVGKHTHIHRGRKRNFHLLLWFLNTYTRARNSV